MSIPRKKQTSPDAAHPLLEIVEKQVLPPLAKGHGRLAPDLSLEVPGHDLVNLFPLRARAPYFEWFWLLRGKAHMKVNDKFYGLRPLDACFLSPQVQFATDVYNEKTAAYSSLWFSNYNEYSTCGLFRYRAQGKWELASYCHVISPPRLSEILVQIQHEIQRPSAYPEVMRRGLMLQLAAMMAQALHKPLSADQINARISLRVLLYLEENYSQKITVDSIARSLHISPSYLAEMFKRETGQTPIEALTEIRLRHARALLLQNQLPVRAVARAVGYSNRSHFSRLFRQRTGLTPAQYGR